MRLQSTIALAVFLAAGGALASGNDFDFAALDGDKSGGLSLAEVQAAAPDVTSEAFGRYDSDSSGELSQTEFAVFAGERTN